jgi:hypothetical protein
VPDSDFSAALERYLERYLEGLTTLSYRGVGFLARGEYSLNYLVRGEPDLVARLVTGTQMGLPPEEQASYEHHALELLAPSGVTPKPYLVDPNPEGPHHGDDFARRVAAPRPARRRRRGHGEVAGRVAVGVGRRAGQLVASATMRRWSKASSTESGSRTATSAASVAATRSPPTTRARKATLTLWPRGSRSGSE